ncbi:DUF6000 family protein [Streptomyces sp. KHY 26]|uniref:DUF6000 family protein n=1 Tax=Streptomyces sp. KHY 26 TaxID=3097359 RepID=UPI00376F35EC
MALRSSAWGKGALLRLDAQLGTDHASRFTTSDGPWERWVDALEQLRAIRVWVCCTIG